MGDTNRVVGWGGVAELEPMLRRALRSSCRDGVQLDDVVQETMLRTARYRSNLSDPERIRGWALRIGNNVLHNARAGDRRFPSHEEGLELEELLVTDARADEAERHLRVEALGVAFDREELLRELRDALRGLSKQDQVVLGLLYRAQGAARAATELGIPRTLVKTRGYRARKRLERRLLTRLRRLEGAGAAVGGAA